MPANSRSAIQLFIDRLLERSPLGNAEVLALQGLVGQTSLARANIDIVSPGETSEHVCLIVDGLAGRFGQVIDGRRQITALHVAGDMCDLHSLVTPSVSWALQAISATVILKLPHRDLRRIARAYPAVAEAFWRDCAVDASVLSQWVVNVGRRCAQSRMAHLICEMAVRMESAGLGTRSEFRFDVSQMQLGDVLGLTSVHVNRTFKLLRNAGLIATENRSIRIRDWEGLAAIGDFDETYLQVGTRARAMRELAYA
jgi:CRP-like cAMP-binding protein